MAPPLGRRPNTIEPADLFAVTDDQLAAMTDEQLIAFADRELSIVIPFGTKRGQIYTRIVNAAMVVRDGR